jgi:hypothetical protein
MKILKNTLVAASLLGSVVLAPAANAMPIGKIYDYYPVTATRIDIVPQSQAILSSAARLDVLNPRTAQVAAERYFDFDTIITLGSLALAGGALAAVAFSASRARRASDADENRELGAGWQAMVMRNLEADLMAYVRRGRRAA